jgi:hypothetical protein
MVEGIKPGERIATCHRAHLIVTGAGGEFLPYTQWIFDTDFRGEHGQLFPTGVGGILYPPGALNHDSGDRKAIARLCPTGDDLWLFWMARRNGVSYKTVGNRRTLINWPGSQTQALWRSNILQGENDRQIRLLAEHYGYPDLYGGQLMRTYPGVAA